MSNNVLYSAEDHTFAICAYGKSRYLEECIKSVLNQTVKTNVLMATSTPSEYLEDLAEKYGIKLFVNEEMIGKSNIATDWEFAVKCEQLHLLQSLIRMISTKKTFLQRLLRTLIRQRSL